MKICVRGLIIVFMGKTEKELPCIILHLLFYNDFMT